MRRLVRCALQIDRGIGSSCLFELAFSNQLVLSFESTLPLRPISCEGLLPIDVATNPLDHDYTRVFP